MGMVTAAVEQHVIAAVEFLQHAFCTTGRGVRTFVIIIVIII